MHVDRLYKNKFAKGSLCLKDRQGRFLTDCPVCQRPIFEYQDGLFRLRCSVSHHRGRFSREKGDPHCFLLCGLGAGGFFQKPVYITAVCTPDAQQRAERRAATTQPLVHAKRDEQRYQLVLYCDEKLEELEPPNAWRERLPPTLPPLPNTVDYATLMQISAAGFLAHY